MPAEHFERIFRGFLEVPLILIRCAEHHPRGKVLLSESTIYLITKRFWSSRPNGVTTTTRVRDALSAGTAGRDALSTATRCKYDLQMP